MWVLAGNGKLKKNMCGMNEEKKKKESSFFSPSILRRKHHTNRKSERARAREREEENITVFCVFKNIPLINNSRTLRYYPSYQITFIAEEQNFVDR